MKKINWMLFILVCGLQFVFGNALTANAETLLKVSAEGEVEVATALTLHPYSYEQDFEEADPFEVWAKNGTYTVNYKGITTERASSGKKSFKIDVTFDSATYLYLSMPVKIPSIGELDFKGDIYTIQNSGAPRAALGTNIQLSPCPRSGVNRLQLQRKSTGEWITQRSDLVDAGFNKAKDQTYRFVEGATHKDVGIWCDKIALYLFGKKGDRITVYVDNIEVKGEVPDIAEYTNITNVNWSDYQQRMNDHINELTENIEYRVDEIEEIKESVEKRGYLLVSDYDLINEIIEDAKFQNLPENETITANHGWHIFCFNTDKTAWKFFP